jgi:hypothetical protein
VAAQASSTAKDQLQVGLPVLDEGKAIGSIVIGWKAASLRQGS